MTYNLALLYLFFISALAFSAEVNGRGELNLQNTSFKFYPLNESSYIHSIHFDELNEYLIIQIHNVYYQHCKIPAKQINKMIFANSAENYYKKNIIKQYPCDKSNIPNYDN